MDNDKQEPIAIVGINLKFPGDAVSAEAFWQLLCEKRCTVGRVPEDRFNVDAFYHPDPARTDSLKVKNGHFIKEDIRAFDAPFFTMSPAEASVLDFQQRGLLEGAYHTFENAGMSVENLAGSNTSVFVASFGRDLDSILLRDPEYQYRYQATSSGATMLSARISHFFDLRGPSLSVDTACSSGLYAFHLACQSLLSGDSEMSLVAGSNTYFTPENMSIPLSNAGFLSADGISYSFDHRANGYARGEGFGFALLKPLSHALRDGDMIRAVVRATGVNQDGRTPSITQPSASAQMDLIHKTYTSGGLDLASTGYVEAHGTGTIVGDPIEASAIGQVFREYRDDAHPLLVGSVKSNIGHLEGASGLAGILKTILMLELGTVPPNVWTEKINPAIDTKKLRIEFPTKPLPWPVEGLRRASVSSFGYGGSNAHVVLDDAFNYLKSRGIKGLHQSVDLSKPSTNGHNDRAITNDSASGSNHRLMLFSAADEDGPKRQGQALQTYLAALPAKKTMPKHFSNLLYTLSDRRTQFAWRSFAVCSRKEAADTLSDELSKTVRASNTTDLHFVFTGQGAQWARMGVELLQYPEFRESLGKCEVHLKSLGCPWSLLDELQKSSDSTQIHRPALAQPVCTAVQVALVELSQSWNVSPSSVCGHSSGEIAAAFCAGALTRESAWQVAYYRGVVAEKLLSLQSEATTMMSVGLGESEIAPYLATEDFSSFVSLGCINSPVNVTLTGTRKHIDRLWEIFDKKEVFVRKLAVDLAYHSKFMKDVAKEYETLIKGINGTSAINGSKTGPRPSIAVYSSVTGTAIGSQRLSQPSYWVENLISPVRFSDALTAMVTGGQSSARVSKQAFHMLVEIGPQAALRRPVQDTLTRILKKDQWMFTSALKVKSNDQRSILEAAGQMWTCGIDVNVGVLNAASEYAQSKPELLADLPGYQFSRAQTYWQESRLSRNYAFRPYRRHQLLGLRAKDWNAGEASWRHFIRAQECPWVMDHGLNNSPLYPGSGMIVMAIEAARQLSTHPEGQITGYRLKHMRFLRAINIDPSEHGTEAQIHLRPRRLASNHTGATWYDWRIYTLNRDDWAECAYGSIKVETADDGPGKSEERNTRTAHSLKSKFEDAAGQCSQSVHEDQMYDNLAKFGFSYGPYFRQLQGLKYSKTGHASATLPLRGYAEKLPFAGEDPCVIHPTTLDALCHLQMVALSHGGWKQMPTMIFSHLRELWVSQKLLTAGGNPLLMASTVETMRGFREAEYDTIAVLADTQEPVVMIEGERGTAITSLSLSAQHSSEGSSGDGIIYGLDFKPDLSLLNTEETRKFLTHQFEKFEPPNKANIDRADAIALYHIERVLGKFKQDGFPAKSKSHVQRYLSWMERIAKDRTKFCLASRGRINLDIQDILRDAHLEPSQHLVAKAGENLYDLLTGKTDPLQVIFEGTSADDFYHSAAFTAGYKKMGAYIEFLAHQNPGLKLLEVGAGTGSSTEQILSFLGHDLGDKQTASRFSEYIYTDISAGFFERARERFHEHAPNMRFQKLDLELDPIDQGFHAGAYDVIVAGNVLHATSDLPRTLRYVRSLLKPGGKLLLAEVVNMNDLRDAFVFGLLPGWWLKPAGETFDQGPLLTEAQWAKLLPQCGFTGLDMSFGDHEELPYHRLSFLVANAADEAPVTKSIPTPQCFILRDNQSKAQESLANLLLEKLSTSDFQAQVMSGSLENMTELEMDMRASFVISLLDLGTSVLGAANDKQFQSIQRIGLEPRYILWVTTGGGLTGQNPDGEIAVGLGRTICSERGDQSFKCLSLSNHNDTAGSADAIHRVYLKMASGPGQWDESEYAQSEGFVQIPRVAPQGRLNEVLTTKTGTPAFKTYTVGQEGKPHFTATIGTPGLLDTIFYIEKDDGTRPLDIGEVEIEIKASSLNFKDLMHALGQIPGKAIGFDGAGIISRIAPGSSFSVGDRVMWSCSDGEALGAFVRCSEFQTQKIPEDLSFKVAASLPVVYSTVIYSLVDLARLKKGESVLIHAGAGGVGQAAIQLAKTLGAGEIFVTVGSEAKRQLLKDLYNIPDNRIFSSRDASFEVDIKQATNGRGVDVILNSLGGDLLQASWDVIAPFGRFIEIGKGDIINNTALPMEPFNRNVTFVAVDVVVLHEHAKHMIKKLLEDFMALREKHPELHEPRPLHVFPASKLEDAFRFLQGGKNTGKTIVDYDIAGDEIQFRPALKAAYQFDGNATYVISGGLGGLGRNMIRWMVGRGAKYFLALSRRGADNNPDAASFIQEIKALGAQVWAPACDVTDRAALRSTLEISSQKYPPVKGCIQGAMVLRDCLFEKMTGKIFQEALAPKVVGSRNLHELLPQNLDFFVLLSSFSGTVGQRGQCNYAAGNTFEDALSRHRISQGMKAVSLNLPVIAEAGWAAENYNSVASTLRTGHALVTQDQLMALLEIVCDPKYDCRKPGAEQLVIITDTPQALWRMAQEGSVDWMIKPLFANVTVLGQTTQAAAGENGSSESETVDYLGLVRASGSLEDAGDVLLRGLVQKLSKALSVPPENLDIMKPAYVLGVDSLIAVEVRYWFVRNVTVEMAVFDILKDQSLVSLCQMVAARVPGVSWVSG